MAARLLMARIFAADREWTQAAEQAELVLKLAPSHPEAQRLLAEALINTGFARVMVGDFDEAVKAFRRAVALDPASARARDLLALALKDQERVASAR